MRLQGTKVKVSVAKLKERIQAKYEEDTAKHEKAVAEYEKKLDKWATETHKFLSTLTVEQLKEAREDKYGRDQWPWWKDSRFDDRPQKPGDVDHNHQRLLNMLELSDEETLTLAVNSEFYRYL